MEELTCTIRKFYEWRNSKLPPDMCRPLIFPQEHNRPGRDSYAILK